MQPQFCLLWHLNTPSAAPLSPPPLQAYVSLSDAALSQPFTERLRLAAMGLLEDGEVRGGGD